MITKNTPAIRTTIHADFEDMRIDFSNGQTIRVNILELSDSIKAQALAHGLKQKLVDAAAISRDALTGRSATIEDKFEAVETVYNRLLTGEWNATREGGSINGGILFRALVDLYAGRKTPEEIKAFLDDKSPTEKAALRKNEKVAGIILEMQAKAAERSGIDTDSMLDELDD